MNRQAEKAERFRSLHDRKKILVLPNCWDVPSARVFEEAGFPAVATSSAGLMVSLGYADGESIEIDVLVAATARVARALTVPLSADVVGGFGRTEGDVAMSVRRIVDAGAVGINIEDFVHESKELVPQEKQLKRLKALIALREQCGVPFVINARTDALRYAPGDEGAKFAEAVKRARAYRDLGVDCVYPMGLVDASAIARFVRDLDFPVNVMVRKGLPKVSELQSMGVARVSFGPSASYATMGLLKRAAREVREKGTYETLVEGAITFDELNSLAVPGKKSS